MGDAIPFPLAVSPGDVPPTSQPPDRLLLDIADLAPMLGLSVRQLRRMDCSGDIPGRVRLGRLVKFRAETIREWVAAGCPEARTWAVMQQRNGRR